MIVAMNYVTLACMKEDKAALLDRLQSSGLVMLSQPEGGQSPSSPAGEQVQRMERLMQQLKPYAPKRGMLAGLPEESAQALQQVDQADQQAVDKMEQLLQQLQQLYRRFYRELKSMLREKLPCSKHVRAYRLCLQRQVLELRRNILPL